jgi:hypothetical protein
MWPYSFKRSFSELGFLMSAYQQRYMRTTTTRLAVLIHDVANLNLQLGKLHGLRERVRQAELSDRESRHTGNRKSRRRDEIQGQLAL